MGTSGGDGGITHSRQAGGSKMTGCRTHQLLTGHEAEGPGLGWGEGTSPVWAQEVSGGASWFGDKAAWGPFLRGLGSLMWLALYLPLSQATLLLPQPSCHHRLCQHLLHD